MCSYDLSKARTRITLRSQPLRPLKVPFGQSHGRKGALLSIHQIDSFLRVTAGIADALAS
jgi:hypothetical protein